MPDSTPIPLIEDAPTSCSQCGQALCVRKQVINLALGNTETMQCLVCLSAACGSTAAAMLDNTRGYVLERECFRKPWQRYRDRHDCPDPDGCIPDVCFKTTGRSSP
ncbi:MAG TPA: hypothetical protein V6C69_10110 [Trichormus sp.]|jgi:hypothetical protein